MSNIDEPVHLVTHDVRWTDWYAAASAEIAQMLGPRVRGLEHFGSTSVPGMAAKPIIDLLVGIAEWPLAPQDRSALEVLGYEHLGEAGVPGREYLRRRRGVHANLAVVRWDGPLWRDNLALRDYLRHHPGIAAEYARAKQAAWADGARTLLAYSVAKGAEMTRLVHAARTWQAGFERD